MKLPESDTIKAMPMNITFHFEAQLREIAGANTTDLSVAESTTLLQAVQTLAALADGALSDRILQDDNTIQSSIMIFVNDVPTNASTAAAHQLSDGDSILLLPPISGG